MASPREPFSGLLRKISVAKLNTGKLTYRIYSNRYKEALKKLTAILRGSIPLRDKSKHEATKELKTLGAILSEEDEKDTSIKDAKRAVREIESKLEIEPLELQAKSRVQGANRFEDDRHQETSTETTRPEVQSSDAVPGKTPFKHEHFITFLKEIKSIISDEQKDFSGEVYSWFPNGKGTRAIRELTEAIAKQRSEREKLESELKDQHDRFSRMTHTPGPETSRLYQCYKSEISLLSDEINDGVIDMSAFKQRSRKYPNDDTLQELHTIRLQLEKRFESSSRVKIELELLVKEVEKAEYEHSSFEKRMKKLKEQCKELEHISKMRDWLKNCEIENKQMRIFISSLKERLSDWKFNKISVKGEMQWQKDAQNLITDMQKLVDAVNSKSYEKIKTEVENLQKCVESKSFDSTAVKWYTKLKKEKEVVMRSLGCIAEQNAVWLSESSKMTQEMTSGIMNLKQKLMADETDGSDEIDDEQWKTDLYAIEKKAFSMTMQLKEMQSYLRLADVLNELRIIEERLIATYKTEDMKIHSHNNQGFTRSGTQRSSIEIVREGLTVMVDKVDVMMKYFVQRMKRLHKENRELAQHNSNMKADILAVQNNMDKSGDEKAELIILRLHKENRELAKHNSNMQADILAIKTNMEQLDNEKAELARRLANIARAKLNENNPNIADLSDPNRPTKLAEQFMEIYDNEWTHAYEALEEGSEMKEQQICFELLKILLNAQSECREMAKKQYEQLCSSCTNPALPEEKGELDSIQLKLINDLRKQTAKLSVSSVQKKILMDKTVSASREVVKYQMKCIEICWYMSLQTPPVILDKPLKEGAKFDRDKYREFTRKGKLVEFVTWPTVLLHKDGPLLCKGVAQGISRLS